MNNDYKFDVVFLDEAKEFLDGLDKKARAKVIYNIKKARVVTDKELFKKLHGNIWEFRSKYGSIYYRLFAFWDKTDTVNTVVVSTHGLVKKTDKISKGDIERAERVRSQYLNNKD